MKVLGAVAVAATVMQTASAHYIWQTVNGGAAYQYFRTNSNYNSPITDTSINEMRCNVGANLGGSTGTLSVAAGTKITLGLDTAVYHQGPVMFYLGKAPGAAGSWDGSGANWFKFYELAPNFSAGGGGSVVWPMSIKYDVTIPASLPAGEWLLRAEQIGLHNPGSPPQFYIGCAQLKVTGGGSCSPSYFSIPGHIKNTDAPLQVNIYSPGFTSYQMPGPAVYSCSGGSTNPQPQPTTTRAPTQPTTTTRAGAQTTVRTTTTSARPQTTAPAPGGCAVSQYQQCGGSGYSGCTTCAGSATCKVVNQYYSQCL